MVFKVVWKEPVLLQWDSEMLMVEGLHTTHPFLRWTPAHRAEAWQQSCNDSRNSRFPVLASCNIQNVRNPHSPAHSPAASLSHQCTCCLRGKDITKKKKKKGNMGQFEIIPYEENLCLSGNCNHPNIKGRYKDALCKGLSTKCLEASWPSPSVKTDGK